MSQTFDESSVFLDDTTSPNQLHEVTYGEPPEPGLVPTTKPSPIRGRSMKEYEERMAQLKKENFNLKLRIYFLEERMGQIHDIKDKEEAVRKNIELKVETESLRKELTDKHELLCQAAKALEVLQEKSKEEKTRHGQETACLESRIQELEKELQGFISAMTQSTDSQYSFSSFEVDQLNAQVLELQEQVKEQKEVINKFEAEQKQKDQMHQADGESQTLAIQKLEEVAGVKQPDLYNRVKQLAECEQMLQKKECTMLEFIQQMKVCKDNVHEVESKLSKERANAANLTAKLNTATLELQRLRDEVKQQKKCIQDLKKNQYGSSCDTSALEETKQQLREQKLQNQELLDKLSNRDKDLKKIHDLYTAKEKEYVSLKHGQELSMRALRGLMEDKRDFSKKEEELKEKLSCKELEIQELSKQLKERAANKPCAVKDSDKDLVCEKDSLHHIQSMEASLREKEAQLTACEQQLETRDNRIVELELERKTLQKQIKDLTEVHSKHVEENLSAPLENEIPQEVLLNELLLKKKEIEALNIELKKRTYNLQELVNKELWDKNKQIERLELRLTAQTSLCDRKELELKEAKSKLAEFGVSFISLSEAPGSEAASDDISKLQEQLKLSFEEQRYLSKQIDDLKKRLRDTPERDTESKKLQRLQEENKKLKAEAENNRVWKKEAAKALSVLRTRLEELAVFLDELLHQPTLVVGLCADRQRALRAVINGSLELSRTIANLSGDSWTNNSCGSQGLNNSPFSKDKSGLAEMLPSAEGIKLDSIYEMPNPGKLVEDQDSELVFRNLDSISPALISSSDDLAEVFKPSLPSACNFDSKSLAFLVDGLSSRSPAVGEVNTEKDESVVPSFTKVRRRSRSQPHGKTSTRLRESVPNINTGSQSDSDRWSGPDRSVSQARMGINNESSRTLSSAASTVRKRSIGGRDSHSSCSSGDSINRRRATVKHACDSEASKQNDMQNLAARTECLEQLNRALQTELRIGQNGHNNVENATAEPSLPSALITLPSSESSKGTTVPAENIPGSHDNWNQLESERSARIAWQQRASIRLQELQDKVLVQERRIKERESDLRGLQHTLTEVTNESEAKEYLSSQKRIHLEDKIQELSVQVLEVEVRREQAEQDAQRAVEDREKIRKDLEGKLAAMKVQKEEVRQEASKLLKQVDQLTLEKSELEQQVRGWQEKVQQMEKELQEWKLIAQKYESDVKEAQVQLSREYKEKLQALEKSKEAAEQCMDGWRMKCEEAEKKRVDVERRARDKIRLLEEQVKLRKVELERRAEEQLEKLKRETEARAARKFEEAVERRVHETQDASDRRLHDAEAALRSRLDDLEKKSANAAADAEKRTQELQERYQAQESNLKARLAEAERRLLNQAALRHQLDQAAVAASQAQLETARLVNAKVQLEQQVRWLQVDSARDRKQMQDQLTQELLTLNEDNKDLRKRVKDLEREIHAHQHSRRRGGSSQASSSSPASPESKVLTEITNLRRHRSTDMSDYVSEEQEQDEPCYPRRSYNCWLPHSPPAVGGSTMCATSGVVRATAASPDLGIESDQGRFSSLEPLPLQKSTTAPALHSADALSSALELRRKQQLDYRGLEQENVELKQRLQHTRQTLEQTYAQLAAANQRKRIVEKAICRQLNKTHHILRRARDNFESTGPSQSHETD